jgi:hypothetical protein
MALQIVRAKLVKLNQQRRSANLVPFRRIDFAAKVSERSGLPAFAGRETALDDAHDLPHQLWARAGVIMEDSSVAALTDGELSNANAKIKQLRQAGLDIIILAAAASVVLRRPK